MRLRLAIVLLLGLAAVLSTAPVDPAVQALTTNRDKVIAIAVQGEVAPAAPSTSYVVTWNGKPKMAIGTGGINYSLALGDPVFGWASADRATVGVATAGSGDDRGRSAWPIYASIGNEVRILSGEARGKRGVVIGKFGGYVLIHFEPAVVEVLALGDRLQAKAEGIGLAIDGHPDVFIHGVAPDLLDKLIAPSGGAIEVPVVKSIPAEIVGQGSGGPSLSGNWHIQTCFPPDIEAHGLTALRYGDLVLLEGTQSDYGRGYAKGAATVGVVCGGPSDVSGLGIGVTPILSSRTAGKLTGRIDPGANIGRFLGLRLRTATPRSAAAAPAPRNARRAAPAGPTTNADSLLTIAVEGVVQPASARDYETTFDGKPQLGIGMASINYTVSLGDPVYGWAETDHVEPDVTIQGRDQPSPSACALAILACIGNEARVVTGEAAGARGYYIGRHAGSDDLVWFPKSAVEKLALNDRIQVKARGVGLKIDGFEDVRVNKMSPELLAKLGLSIENDELVVPVVMEVPGHVMGSGLGGSFLEPVDYDIQTTCPETVEALGLKTLRLGDLVAIRDHYDYYGRGRYEGAVTIGVCIHGYSQIAGHGPGLNPVLSALPGRIKTRIDPDANVAYMLGIKSKPKR